MRESGFIISTILSAAQVFPPVFSALLFGWYSRIMRLLTFGLFPVMIEHLFGSRTRVKLLRLFLSSTQRSFFVREITRLTDEHINSVRRELLHLERISLVTSFEQDRKKFYKVNQHALLFPELKSMVMKSRFSGHSDFLEQLQKTGKIYYLALSGLFIEEAGAPTDIFIVGDIDRGALQKVLDNFQSGFEREIYYTILPLEEYHYRQEIGDKFLIDMMASKKSVVVDLLQQATKKTAPAYSR